MKKSIFTPEYGILRAELVKVRKKAGLTQRELANRLEVSHSWVAKVESGERRVDIVELVWILLACGVPATTALADLASKLSTPRAKGPRKGGRIQ